MRTAKPRVTNYKGSTTSKFVVEGLRVDGKRVRKFFKTRREAEAWLRLTLARIKKEGEGTIHMPEQLRVEATKCAKLLAPHGRTLTEATEFFLGHLKAIERSCEVSVLIQEFMLSKEQDGASPRYLKDLKNRLARFEEDFGGSMVAEIQSASVDDWLRGLQVKAQTRNNFRTVLRTMFEFSVLRGYHTSNPVAKTAKAKVVRGAPDIFSPEQMKSLLECASDALLPHLAIGAFSGLRTTEIERLDWSEIDLKQGLIHVRAEKSKTAQRRLTTISDNLAAWLAPLAKKEGAVSVNIRTKLKNACRAAKVEWKHNVLRHSFASYHLAFHKDAARTALELGHSSPTMMFKHYRELVSPTESERWWQIYPSKSQAAVVQFKEALANA